MIFESVIFNYGTSSCFFKSNYYRWNEGPLNSSFFSAHEIQISYVEKVREGDFLHVSDRLYVIHIQCLLSYLHDKYFNKSPYVRSAKTG